MKDLKDDTSAKEIVRDSYLDLTGPEFKSDTMDRIYRYGRRRRIMENIVVNALAFVAIDALIWLALKLTGLTVARLVNGSAVLLGRYFLHDEQLGRIVGGGNDMTYLLVVICAMVAMLTFIELKMNLWKGGGR